MRGLLMLLPAAGLLAGGLTAFGPADPAQAATTTFAYTGAAQNYHVPAGVMSLTVDAWGAQGGPQDVADCGTGGFGGHTHATLHVTPNQTLKVYVGGAGSTYQGEVSASTAGGFNGGGDGHLDTVGGSRGGGGASDLRSAPYGLSNRLVAAGGGGGAGNESTNASGGAGGGLSGSAGTPSTTGGGGGTQTKGGAAGTTTPPVDTAATDGSQGQGGDGGYTGGIGAFTGGGGGGGWYGGGGAGGNSGAPGAGGGGGSSHGPAGSVYETGVRGSTGACTAPLDGKVVISATPSTGGTYTAVAPKRILDTRTGLGATKGKVGKGKTIQLQVTGRGGLPSAGVSTVVLDLSVASPDAAGFATVYSCGTPRPAVDNVAFSAHEATAALVTSAVNSSGKVCVYVSARTYVVADVSGFFSASGQHVGARFTAVRPAELVDTGKGSVLAAKKVLTLAVLGQKGVPTSGVSAVMLNLIARSPAATGQFTAYPCEQTPPKTTSLAFVKGHSRANAAIVKLGAENRICVVGSVKTALVVVVTGWYGKPGATSGTAFTASKPRKILDTSSGLGATNQPLAAGRSTAVLGRGVAGVPKTGVTSVVLQVRSLNSAASGRLAVYTCGQSVPKDGTLYDDHGRNVVNQVTVKLSAAGQFCVASSVRTDVSAVVVGWYGP